MNFHRAPFLWLSAALVAGMLLPPSWSDVLPAAGMVVVVLSAVALLPDRLSFRWRWRHVPFISLLILASVVGACLMRLERHDTPESVPDTPVRATVRLLAPPRSGSRTLRCRVDVLSCTDSSWKGRKILLILPRGATSEHLEAGETLEVETTLTAIRNWSADFDYAAYMRRRGYLAQAYVADGQWHASPCLGGFSLRVFSEKCRRQLLERYRRAGVEAETLALVAALTLGQKDLTDSQLRERFASVGVAHILAVSGMHVGIVCGLIGLVLRLLGRRRQMDILRQLLLTASLWCYACLTGLSASVLRAVLMFSVMSAGRCIGRRAGSWNVLGFAAFVMLCFNPLWLFDVGFQLSFSAVASILLFQPFFLWQGQDGPRGTEPSAALWGLPAPAASLAVYFRDLVTVSLAAQIGTAPLSVWYFHQFPNYFWLSNLLMVPLALVITCLAVGVLVLGSLPGLGPLLLWLLKQTSACFLGTAAGISSLPAASQGSLHPQTWETALVYVLLVILVGISKNKYYIYSLNRGLRYLNNLRHDFKNNR